MTQHICANKWPICDIDNIVYKFQIWLVYIHTLCVGNIQ